jgi:hypothetical protein
MEATYSSEELFDFKQTTRCYFPGDRTAFDLRYFRLCLRRLELRYLNIEQSVLSHVGSINMADVDRRPIGGSKVGPNQDCNPDPIHLSPHFNNNA